MKKLQLEAVSKVIGGGSSHCDITYGWQGNNCKLITTCYDKHGYTTSKDYDDALPNYCQPK